MADTTPTGATKRALRALAVDSIADGDPAVRVVDEATGALDSVEAASRFVAADGVDRLARAVVTAVRDGDDATVRRGREALTALRAFQSALDGLCPESDERDPSQHPAAAVEHERDADTTNHFHPARGTVLGCGGKRGDR